MSMNCSTCGSPIPDAAAFCVQCGSKVAKEDTAPSVRSAATTAYASRADMQKTRAMPAGGDTGTADKRGGVAQPRVSERKRARYPTDIVVLFDCTGSMGPYIDGMKDMTIGFSRDLEANNIDARLGLVEYRDVKIGEPTRVHGFAATPEEFRGWTGALRANGGGDEPESAIDAGFSAIKELSFRDNATRIFVWITDASYHEPAENGQTMETLIRELAARKTVAYVIGPDLPGYGRLADGMGGIFFDIRKNPEEFCRIVKSLGKSISETVPRMRDIRAAADAALSRTRVW